MKKVILLFIIATIIIACDKTDKNSFTKFPSEYNIEGERIKTNIPFKSGSLYLFDSLLIVTNTFDSKKYIHLFNRTNYKYISSSAAIGKGPGEISNPFLATLDKPERVIWCMDHGKKRILKFPIDSMLADSDYTPTYFAHIPGEKRLIISYAPYNKKLFSFLNNESNTLISFFDHNGKIIDSLNIANNIKFYENIPELRNTYKVLYKYNIHPSKDKMVAVFRYTSIIKILDKEGNILNSMRGPDDINGDPLAPINKAVLAYFDVRSDHKYIYCLYQGGERTKNENGMLISTFPHSLFVFDWDGNPLARINFKHSVSSFEIDQQYNRIITFSPDFGDFVVYKLPDL